MSETVAGNGIDGIKERMNALRQRQEDAVRRRKEEEARKERVQRKGWDVAGELRQAVQGLGVVGLNALAESEEIGYRVNGTFDVSSGSEAVHLFVKPHNHRAESVMLVTFTVATDHDGNEGWIEHDGDRITVEIALEICADFAEKHFAEE